MDYGISILFGYSWFLACLGSFSFVLHVPMITYRSALAGYCIDSSRNQGNVTNELKAGFLGKNRRWVWSIGST